MEGTILNFVELSWGEKTKAVFQALEQRYGEFCVYPIDWFDTSVVAYIYYPSTEDTLLTRVFYSFDENGNVELGDAEQVRIAYENVSKATDAEVIVAEEQAQAEEVPQQEEVAQTEEVAQAEEVVSEQSEISEATEEQEDVVDAKCDDDEKDKEGKCGEIVDSEDKTDEEGKKDEEDDKKDEEEDDKKDEDLSLNEASEPTTESNTSIEDSTLQNNEEGVNITNNEETTNASTFTDSERQEFEALKAEKKVSILNSYKGALPEDILKSFEEQLDTISIEDLDASLAKEFRRVSVESSSKKRSMRTFTLATREEKETRESYLSDLVNKYKTK